MTLEIQKEDIKKLGHTTFQENGLTSFLFNIDDETFWIQEIFLRNILKDISPDYKISSINDFADNEGNITDIIIHTNLPWEEYTKIDSKN